MKRRSFLGAALGAAGIAALPTDARARSGVSLGSGDFGAKYARVTLDGEPLDLCTFADENAGVVREFVRNADGTLAVAGDHIVYRTRYGVVRVSWPDHPEIEAMVRGQAAA